MDNSGRQLRIGISGSYGGMNLGDEAILDSIVSQLHKHVSADITVFSKNAADTLARHQVEHAVDVRSMTRGEVTPYVRDLDVFILGGGGILYDGEAEGYLREVFIAGELGIPVMLYALSAGPLTTPQSRRAVRDALNSVPDAVITVRDRFGYRLLEDVGVTAPIHHTADPAFLLEPQQPPIDALQAEGVEPGRHLVGFSVREPGPAAPHINPDDYYALLANAADFVVERYDADVVFVPMERSDVQHSHAVVAHMKYAERAEISRRRYSPREILYLVGQFDFAIGMRLHFLIFAALQRTPFIALPYASKVTGLLEDLGLEMPPLGAVGVGQLVARIDRSWDTRDDVRTKIDLKLDAVKAKSASTYGFLEQVLPKTSSQLESNQQQIEVQ